jgi:hypothetical protein
VALAVNLASLHGFFASFLPPAVAGLVLVHPYLPALFARAGYTEEGQFKDRASQEAAVWLLHYVATGKKDGHSDSLAIAKILCGLTPDEPIRSAPLDITEQTRELADSLLRALVQNWPPLSNTSVQALRETFISRQGVLRDRGSNWELIVEPHTVDVLMQRLPYRLSPIQNMWMQKPILVEWQQ